MPVLPFKISVPESILKDLQFRLRATRWAEGIDNAGWDYGINVPFLKELVTYWAEQFDWRAVESDLNQHEQVLVDAGGLKVHAVVKRSVKPNAPAVILLHGWPDSFWRFQKVLPLLEEFHIVVPSLPGYGFTERPNRRGVTTEFMADAMAELMSALGFESYVVHGGDIGGFVAVDLAHQYPSSVRGLHLTDVEGHMPDAPLPDFTAAEHDFYKEGVQWAKHEGAYWGLQATKPQTPAMGLNDSPVGLAAWIVEKLRSWSDCEGDVLTRFTRDELLTNLMIYWVTETIGTSFLAYYEGRITGRTFKIDIPTAVATFPFEILRVPREFCERFYNVVRWTEFPRGGHYTAFEEPELFADDLKEFIHGLK